MVTARYVKIANLRGPEGPPGTFDEATAESVPAEVAPSTEISGERGERIHFRIPRGLPGSNAVSNDEQFAVFLQALDTQTRGALDAILEALRRKVPGYVTAVGASPAMEFDRTLHLYHLGSEGLFEIRRSIARAQFGLTSCHVMFIGDSKTAGNGGGFAASVPSRIKDLLGGRDGMLFAAAAAAPARDARWTIDGFTATGNNLHLNAASNGTSTAQFNGNTRCTGFRVWYYQSGSLGARTVSVDGGSPVALVADGTRIPPDATTGFYYTDFAGLADATHSIRISATLTGGAFYLLGVEQLQSEPRVQVTNAGLSGSTVAGWMPGSTSQMTVFNQAPGLFSSLAGAPGNKVAIVQLGTNTSENEVANMLAIGQELKAIGWDLMFVVPGGTTTASGSRVTFKRALYEHAETLNVPLVDFTDLIGNTVAQERGYMADSLHENARGYSIEAFTLSRVLA